MTLYLAECYDHVEEIRAVSPEAAAGAWIRRNRDSRPTTLRTEFWNVRVALAPRKVGGKRPWPSDWDGYDIVQHPKTPPCRPGKKHTWKHGPVGHHGGGIAYTDTCSRCGVEKFWTNCGQNSEDGSEGHELVEYTAPA